MENEVLNDLPLSYQEKLKAIIGNDKTIPRCEVCEFLVNGKICYFNPPVPYPVNAQAGSLGGLSVVSVRPSIANPKTDFCGIGFTPKETEENIFYEDQT